MMLLVALWVGAFVGLTPLAFGINWVLKKCGYADFRIACLFAVLIAVSVYTLDGAGTLSEALVVYVPTILAVYLAFNGRKAQTAIAVAE